MDEDRDNKGAQPAYLYFKLYRCVVSAGSFGILCLIISVLLLLLLSLLFSSYLYGGPHRQMRVW